MRVGSKVIDKIHCFLLNLGTRHNVQYLNATDHVKVLIDIGIGFFDVFYPVASGVDAFHDSQRDILVVRQLASKETNCLTRQIQLAKEANQPVRIRIRILLIIQALTYPPVL